MINLTSHVCCNAVSVISRITMLLLKQPTSQPPAAAAQSAAPVSAPGATAAVTPSFLRPPASLSMVNIILNNSYFVHSGFVFLTSSN